LPAPSGQQKPGYLSATSGLYLRYHFDAYWITRPFYEQNAANYAAQRIDNLLKNIDQHEDELTAWKNDPFDPDLIARYRPVAYQKMVVMKYIDNLIAWGDRLFQSDTIEAINEATTLYVLAYELLGRRPVKVPNVEHADKSYLELTANGGLDPFGNKQVDILMENFTSTPVRVTRVQSGTEPLPGLDVLYFGIPNNDALLGYWDKVEDRLFKIRHCLNIQGVFRQLPLFEPPIDPALLVKAAAAGVDLSSVAADLAAPPSPYRYRQVVQKAIEFCAEVKALGDKLLSALEKYDAEAIALMRSASEIRLLKAVRDVKKQQVDEANEAIVSLQKSQEMAQQRKDYYESRDFMNPWEITALSTGRRFGTGADLHCCRLQYRGRGCADPEGQRRNFRLRRLARSGCAGAGRTSFLQGGRGGGASRASHARRGARARQAIVALCQSYQGWGERRGRAAARRKVGKLSAPSRGGGGRSIRV
jgi:hypothetical protein